MQMYEKIQENKAKILEVCHGVPDTSGIYFFTREVKQLV